MRFLSAKYAKNVFSAPDPTGGAYSAPLLLGGGGTDEAKGMGGKGRGGKRGRERGKGEGHTGTSFSALRAQDKTTVRACIQQIKAGKFQSQDNGNSCRLTTALVLVHNIIS